MENLFFKEKPVRTMVYLYENQNQENYTSSLRKVTGTTYAHATKIVGELEKEGYLGRKEDGRKKIIHLTPEGEHLGKQLSEIVKEEMWS